jgi:hypothetical protein
MNLADIQAVRQAALGRLPRTSGQQPPGTTLARVLLAVSRAKAQDRDVASLAREMFRDDTAVHAIARTLTGSADTSTADWAAALVRTETRALIEELAPISAWATLGALGVATSYNGAQSVVVPDVAPGDQVAGGWTGEGGVLPLVAGGLASARVKRHKLGGIIAITQELRRASDADAVSIMRGLLLTFLGNLLDSSMLDAVAEVPGVRPAGVLYGVTPIAGAAGGGETALAADLKAVAAAFLAAGVNPASMALIVSPMEAISLATMPLGAFTVPVIASAFVAPGSAVIVAAAHFATAADPVEIDSSEEATLTMANADLTAPTQAGAAVGGGAVGTAAHEVIRDGGIPVSGGTGASVAGATALSMFQGWMLGVRVVLPCSFAITRAGAVQQITGITW